MLPILLEQIPQSEDIQLWRDIEKQLVAIAAKEKRDEIDNRDRIAQKTIPMAQLYARKRQWSALWEFLRDRLIIAIKPVEYTGALLRLCTMQVLSRCLDIPQKVERLPKPVKPIVRIKLLTFWTMRSLVDLLADNIAAPPPKRLPKPKSPRSPKPKKAKKKKVAKKKTVKKFKPFGYHLMRINLMGYLANFLDWCKIFHRRQGRSSPSMESRLKRRSSQGYLCFAEIRTFRIGKNVKSMLLKWSGKPHTRLPRHSDTVNAANRSRRSITQEVLNNALSDNWMDTGAIAIKLSKITGEQLSFDKVGKLLIRRADIGEIYRYKNSGYHLSLYSRNPDAVIIERSWLTLSEAYALAVERGCQCGINTFRKNWQFKYSKFNLEFRKEVPVAENPLLRWKDINASTKKPRTNSAPNISSSKA